MASSQMPKLTVTMISKNSYILRMIIKCVLWSRGDDTDLLTYADRRRPVGQPPAVNEADIAFLLAQLGAYAAERFGERAAALDFTRPQAGLLRLFSREPGQSQQAVARLGTPPSRWSRWWTAWNSAA